VAGAKFHIGFQLKLGGTKMLAKKHLLVGILTLLSVSLAIADPPAVHPTTGEPLVIDCLRGTPDAIDGDLSDWNLGAMTPAVLDTEEQIYPDAFQGVAAWDSPEDCSGEFYLLWDDENIYIAVVVKDDALSMNKSGGYIWNADCVEIFFSTTNAVDSSLGYMTPAACAEHYQYGFNANEQTWNWCNMDGPGQSAIDYLQVASTETADGYIIEASIEYGQMLSLDFSVGNTIGFHPVFDDTDNGNVELHMTWTGRAAHDQSQGYGHIVLSADAVPEPEPEPVNPGTEALVAHWPLDEGAGNTAADIVGGHDGTLKGGVAWAGEGSPLNGDALSFDGYSDGVAHATDPGTINWVSVDPFDVVGPGITLAAWIRPEGFDIGDARIITKQKTWSSSDIWWMLSTYTDGTALRMRLKTDDGGADNGTTTMFSDTGYLEVGVWSHVAATYDGSKMRLYHNAVEIMSTDKTGTIQADPTAAVAIGNSPLGDPGGLRATFHGLIDDVRAYSRALSEPEFRYLAGKRATPVDPGTDGLVAYYPLENDVLDGSGNGNDGTIVGAPTFVDGPAGYGTAMEFHGLGAPGGGGDYIDCGNDASLDITGPISLALWIRPGADDPEGQGTETAPMAKAMSGVGWSWQVRYGWGSDQPYMAFTFNTSPRAWAYVGRNLERDEWCHIACSHDGTTLKCYLNGEQTDSTPMGQITSSEAPVLIGSDGWGCDWIGAIDEVAIYNQALSTGEARYLAGYRAPVDPGTDGLVAYYALENDVLDGSGNELHGTIVGEPSFVEAQVGMGLEFDGVDDRVTIADDAAFDAMSEKFTITAWIKLSAEGTTDRRPILSKELEPDPDGRGWEFKVNNGQLAMQLYSPVEGEGKLTITGTAPLEAGQWYHVAGIYQADGLEQFYINGQLDHEQELVTALQANDSPGNIGAYIWSPTGYQKYFAGLIDEVRAYSRVLSEPEVRYLAGDE
jgi:hypothetical protein